MNHKAVNNVIETYSWVKNKQLHFTACCENVAKLAGAESPQNLIGQSDFDLPWRNRADLYLQEENIALNKKTYKQYQLQDTVTGTIKILVTKSPLLNKHGDIVGTIGSSINVTNIHLSYKAGRIDKPGNLWLSGQLNGIYLTKTEVLVLSHVLNGRSSTVIATHISRSIRTVEHHINTLKFKLQCQTKGDIIATAIQHGLMYLCG